MTLTKSLIVTTLVLSLLDFFGAVDLTIQQILLPLLIAAIFNAVNYLHLQYKVRGFKKALVNNDMETILNDDTYKEWLRQCIERQMIEHLQEKDHE